MRITGAVVNPPVTVPEQTGRRDSAPAVHNGTAAAKPAGDSKGFAECTGTDDYIRYLESLFPGRKVDVVELGSEEDIRRYALSHAGQFRLVLSPKALERMKKDPVFEKECIEALKKSGQEQAGKIQKLPSQGKCLTGSGLVLDENGDTASWVASVTQNVQPEYSVPKRGSFGDSNTDAYGKGGRTGSKSAITIEKSKPRYVPSRDLVKIARAINRQAVKKTISGIHAQIYQIRSGGGDKREKAVLVRQAGQVLLKAELKEKLMQKEELLDVQQKKAALKSRRQKSFQLKQLLKRRQQARKVREYGQIKDYYESPWERQERRSDNEYDAVIGSDSMNVGQIYCPPAGTAVYAGAAVSLQGGGVTGASVDITV